jgi:adenylate cyclase
MGEAGRPPAGRIAPRVRISASPTASRPPRAWSPRRGRKRLFAILKHLLHARARREPVVILVEDLQWIDGGSAAFLVNLVDALPGTRTLLLVNFRPEYQSAWLTQDYHRQLALEPLGPEAIAEMLRELLGTDPSLAGLAARVRERTGGNPFFIEEVRALVR